MAALLLAACEVEVTATVETVTPQTIVSSAPSVVPTPSLFQLGQPVRFVDGSRLIVYSMQVPAPGPFGVLPGNQQLAGADIEACAGPAPLRVGELFRSATGASFGIREFALLLPDNARVQADVVGWVMPPFRDTSLLANDCVRGWLTFIIPAGVQPATLLYGTEARWRLP